MAVQRLRIDLVSDVMCPWCLIGWLKFQSVMAHYAGRLAFDVRWRPFELNPDMAADGVNAATYLAERYGVTREQGRSNRQKMAEMAAELGFALKWGADFRMRNSFNAHRLLAWAEAVEDAAGEPRSGEQSALAMGLFRAHFSEGGDVNDAAVLADIAAEAGLNGEKARQILAGDLYADLVRAEEAHWHESNVSSVPMFILDGRMMVPGAQEPDVFMRVIDRKILAIPD